MKSRLLLHFTWHKAPSIQLDNETPEEALIRETQEEVGMNITVKKTLYTWSFIRKEVNQTVGITFLCETDDETPILSKEHTDYEWVDKNEYDKWDFSEGHIRDFKKLNWNI